MLLLQFLHLKQRRLQHGQSDAQHKGGGERCEGEGEAGAKPPLEHPARAFKKEQGDEDGPNGEQKAKDDLGYQKHAQARQEKDRRGRGQKEGAEPRPPEKRRGRGGSVRRIAGSKPRQIVKRDLQTIEYIAVEDRTVRLNCAEHRTSQLLGTLKEEAIDQRLIGVPLGGEGNDGAEFDGVQSEIGHRELRAPDQEAIPDNGHIDRQKRGQQPRKRAGRLEDRHIARVHKLAHIAVYDP